MCLRYDRLPGSVKVAQVDTSLRRGTFVLEWPVDAGKIALWLKPLHDHRFERRMTLLKRRVRARFILAGNTSSSRSTGSRTGERNERAMATDQPNMRPWRHRIGRPRLVAVLGSFRFLCQGFELVGHAGQIGKG